MHTALQCGLLRVALGLCDGGMLTLPYSLEASGIPDAHQTSAFGLSHSGAQMGSAAVMYLAAAGKCFRLICRPS